MERELSPQAVADKVFELTEQFGQYVFGHPEILDSIPEGAALVFLDVDDPAFNQANLALAEGIPMPSGSERVLVRMQKRVRVVEQVSWAADIMLAPQLA